MGINIYAASLASLVAGLSLAAATPASSADSPYDACVAITVVQPKQALSLASAPPLAGTESGWHCQAIALYELQRYAEAGELFTLLFDALEDEPTAKDFVASLAAQAAEAFANDPTTLTQAVEWAQKWSQVEPQNIDSWFLQAELLSESNQLDQAMFPALQAQTLATAKHRPRALAVTAGIRLRKGDLASAQDDLYTALELNPVDETSLYVLGHWYWAQGDKLNAQEIWQKLNEVSQDPHWTELAKQELARF